MSKSKPTEKLTLQAVKQQDSIHPTFKAPQAAATVTSSKLKEQLNGKAEEVPRRRSRVHSTSESVVSARSPVRSKPGMTIFRVVAATRTWQRLAKRNSARNAKPKFKLENTYRLDPKEEEKFKSDKATKLLKDVLENRLEHEVYDANKCATLCKDLSTFIKNRLKCLGFPRYRYIVQMTIIEKKDVSLQVSSRFLWNTDHDRFASYSFTNSSMIATVNVYAVYFE